VNKHESFRKIGAALNQYYYVVAVEIETVIEADSPTIAHDALHEVFHELLDPLDRNQWPRVVCNLAYNVTDWKLPDPPMLSAVTRQREAKLQPLRERTVLITKKNLGLPKLTGLTPLK